ncbi:MAG: hypothetical protein AB8G05_13365 [Oligoflexales bacterium]
METFCIFSEPKDINIFSNLKLWTDDLNNIFTDADCFQLSDSNLSKIINQLSFIFFLSGDKKVSQSTCKMSIDFFARKRSLFHVGIIQPWINLARIHRLERNFVAANEKLGQLILNEINIEKHRISRKNLSLDDQLLCSKVYFTESCKIAIQLRDYDYLNEITKEYVIDKLMVSEVRLISQLLAENFDNALDLCYEALEKSSQFKWIYILYFSIIFAETGYHAEFRNTANKIIESYVEVKNSLNSGWVEFFLYFSKHLKSNGLTAEYLKVLNLVSGDLIEAGEELRLWSSLLQISRASSLNPKYEKILKKIEQNSNYFSISKQCKAPAEAYRLLHKIENHLNK